MKRKSLIAVFFLIFTLTHPEFDLGAFPRPCLIGVSAEATAGAGGIAGAASSASTQIRRITVLAWKR
jgi:hypothetical protein